MSHVQTLSRNKALLLSRFAMLTFVREFFASRALIEVDAPLILRLPGQEPYLSPMALDVHDDQKMTYRCYLHTSPEYAMKKMLAAGFPNMFYLGKCFRDYESFGGTHNPEFTMIEWYRTHVDFWALMDDVEQLCSFVSDRVRQLDVAKQLSVKQFSSWKRVSMKALWMETIGVNLDDYLTTEAMIALGRERGYAVADDEQFDNAFYHIFLNEVEPKIAAMGNVILHHYPAQMAALSRLSVDDSRYAERFEVYIDGIELANAFSELTDANEQQERLEGERELKRSLGHDVYDVDMQFIEAVGMMPASAGIALGFDRLVQITLGCQNINDVIVLPMAELMS